MNRKQLGKALCSGRNVYGTLVTAHTPHWVPIICSLGLDFVFIDTEHTPMDRITLGWMCRTYAAHNLSPLVRIPTIDMGLVRPAIDAGAAGVIVPYIERPEDVRQLVAAVRNRPIQGKKLRQIIESESVSEGLQSYIDSFNEDIIIIANIESVEAVNNLKQIVSIPGLNAVLVGPHDLSISMNIPEQYDSAQFDEQVRRILHIGRQAGIGAGIHFAGDFQQQIEWTKAGANFVLYSSDKDIVQKYLRRDIAAIREAVE